MNTRRTVRDYGPGAVLWLFLLFYVLKLAGALAWSWWWVTSPLWISFLAFFVVPVLGLTYVWLSLTHEARKVIKQVHRQAARARKEAGTV